VADFGLLWIA